MKNLILYELMPPTAAVTGERNPTEQRLEALLYTLKTAGWPQTRLRLDEQPLAFLRDERVSGLLDNEGDAAFPLFFVDGELLWKGVYPTADELASALGCTAFLDALKNPPPVAGHCVPDACAACAACRGWDEED